MPGLSEAQELLRVLQECNELLTGMQGIQPTVDSVVAQAPTVEKAGITAQQTTRILFRLNHIMAHMGLGDDVNHAIAQLQRLVFIMRMVQMSMAFLAAGTPYGLIMGVLGIATAGIGMGELLSDNIRGAA